MAHILLACGACGPTAIDVASAELHVNRSDGFRLLTAPCPTCGDLLASADPATLDTALDDGVRLSELRQPLPPIAADDLLDLHERLADDDWCARLVSGEA